MLLLIVWLVVSTRYSLLFMPSDVAGVRTLRTEHSTFDISPTHSCGLGDFGLRHDWSQLILASGLLSSIP
jgi:hypothetical protein